MSANKLFFIGLAVVAVIYFVAVGSNARHGNESPSQYETEQQQNKLVDKYKSKGLKTVAELFDPFAAKIDIFAEVASDDPPSPDRCKVVGNGKERAIVLSKNDKSCQIALSKSDESYRKMTLTFNFNEPGSVTRGGGALKPFVLDRSKIGRVTRIPPFIAGTAEVDKLEVTLTTNERPNKPGNTVIHANNPLKIAVQELGGQLKLSCEPCSRTLYVRVD
ncbi:MAG: hypothetical protein ACU85E_08930 [Gammaproteobacteria bacterium]